MTPKKGDQIRFWDARRATRIINSGTILSVRYQDTDPRHYFNVAADDGDLYAVRKQDLIEVIPMT